MAERKTMDQLREEVRATGSLVVRLERCLTKVGAIASGRDMRMTVPPRSDDDDIFLAVTLADAVEALCTDGVAPSQAPSSAIRDAAYDQIDRYLRNNLSDEDYADYSQALDLIYTAGVGGNDAVK